jgi:plastocyanin
VIPPRVYRSAFAAAVACIAISLPGCAHSTPSAEQQCADTVHDFAPVTNRGRRAATGTVVKVDAANAAFTPTCTTEVTRGSIDLAVRNSGKVLHNVEITAQHIKVDVAPGKSVTVRVRIGTRPVVFVCSYHRSLGMVGILVPRRD